MLLVFACGVSQYSVGIVIQPITHSSRRCYLKHGRPVKHIRRRIEEENMFLFLAKAWGT
jgi:hypothetical protein